MKNLLIFALLLSSAFCLHAQTPPTTSPDFIFLGVTNIAPASNSLSSMTGIAAFAKTVVGSGNHPVLSYTSATYSSSGFILQEGILVRALLIKDLSVFTGFDAGVQNANTTTKPALSYGGLVAYPITKDKKWHMVLAGRNLFVGTVGGPIITFGVSFHVGN